MHALFDFLFCYEESSFKKMRAFVELGDVGKKESWGIDKERARARDMDMTSSPLCAFANAYFWSLSKIVDLYSKDLFY